MPENAQSPSVRIRAYRSARTKPGVTLTFAVALCEPQAESMKLTANYGVATDYGCCS